MIRIAAIAAIFAALTTPALATMPRHPGQAISHHVTLTFTTASKPKTFMSTALVAGRNTHLQAAISFDGKVAQSCWSDTALQFECAWRGVIVVVSSQKKVAPMTVRVASARFSPVRVRVSLSWNVY